MLKKHPTCRWRSEKIKSRRYFIWSTSMVNTCVFSNWKSHIDADIDLFKCRIKAYKELLKIEYNENWWNEDIYEHWTNERIL